jgi:hypothetical protein
VTNLALVVGLCIVTVGGVGILAPSGLVWIAQHSVMLKPDLDPVPAKKHCIITTI